MSKFVESAATASGVSGKKGVALSEDGVNWDYLTDVVDVSGLKGSPGLNYKYLTKTILVLTCGNGDRYSIECQGVTNQSTWDGGTPADLQQAKDDVMSWI